MISVLGFRLLQPCEPFELSAEKVARLSRAEVENLRRRLAPELQWHSEHSFAYHHGTDGSIVEFRLLNTSDTVSFKINGFFGTALEILRRFHDEPHWLLIDTEHPRVAWHPSTATLEST